MRHKFLSALDVFAVNRMLDKTVNANRDGVGHFVRSDNADFLGALADLNRFLARIAARYSRNRFLNAADDRFRC